MVTANNDEFYLKFVRLTVCASGSFDFMSIFSMTRKGHEVKKLTGHNFHGVHHVPKSLSSRTNRFSFIDHRSSILKKRPPKTLFFEFNDLWPTNGNWYTGKIV